jgi:hypothetical protein
MNRPFRFNRLFHRLSLPSSLLVALLQRLPALPQLGTAMGQPGAAPLAAVLRSAFAGFTSMGVLHTLAGATRATSPVPPAITTQPVGQTVAAGASLVIYAVAVGNPTPTYQWQKDGANIPGANIYYYSLANVQTGNAGTYTVVVSNALGSVTSVKAVVNVNAPPAITTQPASQSVTTGATVSFSVSASGNPAPSYQWRKNGANLAGATTSSLTLASVQLGDAGIYDVVTTNSSGSATSNGATLTVSLPAVAPAFATLPGSQKLNVGANATFTAVASGSPAPTYQWRKDGAAIPGASLASLTLAHVQRSDAGVYTVVATNSAGSVASSGATLTVVPAPVAVVFGDFDGDGRADILLTNAVTGDRAIWLMNGAAIASGVDLGVLSTDWSFSGTGDFNGDGKADIFLTNNVTGERAVWLMNGTTIASGMVLGVLSTDWAVSGTGDFDGDGKTDLFLTNTVTGERAVWLMNGAAIAAGADLGVLSTDWTINGTGDFDGDGKCDLVLTNTVTGDRALWFMNGTAVSGASLGVLTTDWAISGTGDFDGEGRSDLLLTNTVTGDRAIWFMNGAAVSGASLGVLATDWTFSGTGDFNRDGKADILLTNTATGDRAIWLMNGATFSGALLGVVSTDWLIRN